LNVNQAAAGDQYGLNVGSSPPVYNLDLKAGAAPCTNTFPASFRSSSSHHLIQTIAGFGTMSSNGLASTRELRRPGALPDNASYMSFASGRETATFAESSNGNTYDDGLFALGQAPECVFSFFVLLKINYLFLSLFSMLLCFKS